MLKAISDGADVVSMSLGSLNPDEADDPFKDITASLNSQGIAVIVAAGNEGDLGPFSTSAPAMGTAVLVTCSVDNTIHLVTYQLSDTRGRHFRYASIFPIGVSSEGLGIIILVDGEFRDITLCYESEFAAAAAKLVDPNTTILAIKTDSNYTNTTEAAAARYRFKCVIMYSIADSQTTPYLDYYGIEPLENGPEFLLFSDDVERSRYAAQSLIQATGGSTSNFSSFSPSTELDMKPQITVPGGKTLSTWPLSSGRYVFISRTSLATPFTAGCYALGKSQLPALNVNEIFNLLMNTASPLSWFYEKAIISSAALQGTRLPHAALVVESLISPQPSREHHNRCRTRYHLHHS
ncbi:peptidase S8/S53 domain-containing protein [Leptodontidium sp. 2 PMI_412]|nr:peptidase S8/S53 domain-containing protein [Leptodontidium sp. 2 PMI_412]